VRTLLHSTVAAVAQLYFDQPLAMPRAHADMRKAMARDVNKESIVPLKQPVRPHDLEFD
jgi:hypothetical protein